MQTKIRIAIAHKEYTGSYINRMSSGLTTDLDQTLMFKDVSEASEWLLNAIYAPADKTPYKYAQIEITKRDIDEEDKPNGADIHRTGTAI